jgi:hypothetical protein
MTPCAWNPPQKRDPVSSDRQKIGASDEEEMRMKVIEID